jgi:hypothetical protein
VDDELTDVRVAEDAQALEDAADEAILACGGDMRGTIKALILANGFLEDELSKVSYGYARGLIARRGAG